MAAGSHPPLEDYLEAIHGLEEEGTPVIQARLARRLGHSPPSVSEMVRRLRSEGWVELTGRSVTLTTMGRDRAESVVRKHRLAERLLTDVIGLPWHKAHVEAGRWEHVISDEVEARLVEILGHPTTCPHGNPIPGTGREEMGQMALSEVKPGSQVRLERVTEVVETDEEALTYLGTHGFVPGAQARVRGRDPAGTVVLELPGRALALGPALCEQLFVTSL